MLLTEFLPGSEQGGALGPAGSRAKPHNEANDRSKRSISKRVLMDDWTQRCEENHRGQFYDPLIIT